MADTHDVNPCARPATVVQSVPQLFRLQGAPVRLSTQDATAWIGDVEDYGIEIGMSALTATGAEDVDNALGFINTAVNALSLILNSEIPVLTTLCVERSAVPKCPECGKGHKATVEVHAVHPSPIGEWQPQRALSRLESSAALGAAHLLGAHPLLRTAADRYRRALHCLEPGVISSPGFYLWSSAEAIGRHLYEFAKQEAQGSNKDRRRAARKACDVPENVKEEAVPSVIAENYVFADVDGEAIRRLRAGWVHAFQEAGEIHRDLAPYLRDAFSAVRSILLPLATPIAEYHRIYTTPHTMRSVNCTGTWEASSPLPAPGDDMRVDNAPWRRQRLNLTLVQTPEGSGWQPTWLGGAVPQGWTYKGMKRPRVGIPGMTVGR